MSATRPPLARIAAVGTAAALVAGGAAGCSGSSTGGLTAGATLVLAAHAAEIPVDGAQRAQSRRGANDFAVALLHRLGAGDGDLTFSPQTLSGLLAMVLPGARGQTAAQVTSALGADGLTPAQLAAALGADDATTRADARIGAITLRISSDVWTDKTVKPAEDYLSTIDGAFGSGLHQFDFADEPDSGRDAVNQLVSQETNGYIPTLFGPSDITSGTRMVLTDAFYLDAHWDTPFDPAKTNASGTFTHADGSTQTAAMMSRQGMLGYAAGPGWQLAELPYQGGKLAMDVLVPTSGAGSLAALREKLTGSSLTAMLGSLRPTSVQLTLPRFTADSSLDTLKQVLGQLGITDLFTPGTCDLTGLTADQEKLSVTAVVAKAHIAVAEQGTVAAAAAGAAIGMSAQAPSRVSVTADHPFLYLIRDLTTGQILFLGQESSI